MHMCGMHVCQCTCACKANWCVREEGLDVQFAVMVDKLLFFLRLQSTSRVFPGRREVGPVNIFKFFSYKQCTSSRKPFHTINFARLLVTLEKREGACALYVRKNPDMFTKYPTNTFQWKFPQEYLYVASCKEVSRQINSTCSEH